MLTKQAGMHGWVQNPIEKSKTQRHERRRHRGTVSSMFGAGDMGRWSSVLSRSCSPARRGDWIREHHAPQPTSAVCGETEEKTRGDRIPSSGVVWDRSLTIYTKSPSYGHTHRIFSLQPNCECSIHSRSIVPPVRTGVGIVAPSVWASAATLVNVVIVSSNQFSSRREQTRLGISVGHHSPLQHMRHLSRHSGKLSS